MKEDINSFGFYICFLCKKKIEIQDLAGINCGMIRQIHDHKTGAIRSSPFGEPRYFCKGCCPNGIPQPEIVQENPLLRDLLRGREENVSGSISS